MSKSSVDVSDPRVGQSAPTLTTVSGDFQAEQ